MKLNYSVTIGSKTFKLGDNNDILDIETSADLKIPVNACTILLNALGDLIIALEDKIEVSLGESRLEKVFTGVISAIDYRSETICIRALSLQKDLVKTYINTAFEKQDAGKIVKKITSDLKLVAGKIDTGLEFPMVVIDQGKSTWQHISDLALRCGFDFYSDENDKVQFSQVEGKTHTFNALEHIIEYEIGLVENKLDGVEVYGESPAGQGQGEEASNWFRKKEVKGSAGKTSGNVRRIVDPLARNQNLSKSIAKNIFDASQITKEGQVEVVSGQAVKLCDKITLGKIAIKSLNGTYKVTGVQHHFNGEEGFTTLIKWIEV